MTLLSRVLAILLGVSLFAAIQARAAAPTPAFAVRVIGHGKPVLLIPGLTCSGDVWDATVQHLAATHEVHVFTLAGFAGQPSIGVPFLPRVREQMVGYVRARHLKNPTVIGHSLGGFMAYWLAASEPDLFGAIVAVDGVPFLPALMNPAATVESAKPQAEAMAKMIGDADAAAFAANLRSYLSTQIREPADVERVLASSVKTDPHAEAQALVELMTTDLRPQLSKIKKPNLLIGAGAAISGPAMKDLFVQAYQAQIANVPQHEFVLAEKARHFVMLDDPVFFFATLDEFLARAEK
jgi:N-formylmaleamate deformylase